MTTVGALFVAGLLGNLGHCLGMCGPLVIVVAGGYPRRGVGALPYHGLYLSAKAGTYGLLGLLAGGLGALAFRAAGTPRLSAYVSLVAGAIVVVAGLAFLGVIRLGVGRPGVLGTAWSGLAGRVRRLSGARRALGMGALNGLLPCPLVYNALLIAAASGSVPAGGLGMLAFGAGTVPVLLAVGLGAGWARMPSLRRLSRLSGAFVVLVGVQLGLRGLAALGLVPHLMLGRVMVW